ncbi:hypothetical protein, partial [Acinetobacter baumannii]|uniref:hypothetical protein n=1 Tax=Acinetobacter baumannii TaxID=470 RepID=UPI001AEFC9D2
TESWAGGGYLRRQCDGGGIVPGQAGERHSHGPATRSGHAPFRARVAGLAARPLARGGTHG